MSAGPQSLKPVRRTSVSQACLQDLSPQACMQDLSLSSLYDGPQAFKPVCRTSVSACMKDLRLFLKRSRRLNTHFIDPLPPSPVQLLPIPHTYITEPPVEPIPCTAPTPTLSRVSRAATDRSVSNAAIGPLRLGRDHWSCSL